MLKDLSGKLDAVSLRFITGRRAVPLAVVVFLICATTGFLLRAGTLSHYLGEPKCFLDVCHYIRIARFGYVPSNPAMTAFYPLWPLVIEAIKPLVPESFLIPSAGVLAFSIFVFTLYFLHLFLRPFFFVGTTSVMLVFALNPMSVFHAIGYSESLASLLTVAFFWTFARTLSNANLVNLVVLFLSAMLVSLSRPTLLQTFAASLATLVFVSLLWGSLDSRLKRSYILAKLSLISGSLFGYAVFGWHMLRVFGDFFKPFSAQAYWNRKFGFYWELIFRPRSVSNSHNVLFWDLLAFWLPPILLGLFFIRLLKVRCASSRAPLSVESSMPVESSMSQADGFLVELPNEFSRYLLLIFSFAFCAAQGLAAFLSYPIFMSLGRHVFATPAFFIGCALMAGNSTRPLFWNRVFYGVALFSAFWLVYWWTRYGRAGWLG